MLRAAAKCGDVPIAIALLHEQRANCKLFSEIQERILAQSGARRTILPSDRELEERARQAFEKALGIDGPSKDRIEHENGGGDSG
jgi:hypothetical protein